MSRVRAAFAFALLTAFGVNCSSDPDPSSGNPDDSTAADVLDETDGTTDAGPTDKVAPTFAGIKDVVAIEERKVAVSWDPGNDDVSPQGRIAYRVYASAPGGAAVDWTAPVAVSIPGDTSVKVDGLTPGASYLFAVRAVDEAGNEDANTKTAAVTLMDVTPPKFGGVLDVHGTDATHIAISWNPATDNGSPSSEIKYRVYVSPIAGMHDFTAPTFTTLPGKTAAIVDALLEAKTYYVVVRAVDAVGNEDGNLRELSGATLDKTAPTFGGVATATALGTSITLSWSAASDNVDSAPAITYDVYRAKGTVADFSKPTISLVGVTGYTFTGLDVSTAYHFVVRARDSSGNQDTNTVDKTATTAASPDINPPTFGGLVSATATSASSIDLKWTAATDDYPGAIFYDIYQGTSPSGEDFSAPIATVSAATTYTVTGLRPLKPYYFVVRARDTAGNRDANVVEKTATTPADTTRPTFSGLATVTSLGPTQLQLSWAPATDDVTASSAIVYRIFQASSPGGEAFGSPTATTSPGASSFVINGLSPDTTYYFVVRAVDEAGLSDSNTTERSGKTDKDVKAPTFAGIVSLTALDPISAVATWSPANDDVTPSSGIVYDVYAASTAGGESFATPTATTAPGATSYTFTGLSPKQNLYVVVRARDASGNRDANTVEKGTTTPADTTPPVFAGATSISGASATALTVNWAAATDNVSAAANIKYQVCKSLTATGCDGGAFFASATVTGLLSYQFTGLTPLATYYFRVRAQDEAGNIDGNTVVISGNTVNDTTAPTFTGCSSAVAAGGSAGAAAIVVSWPAATDDVSSPSQIVYDVWRSTTTTFNFATSPTYTSSPGATSLTATGLNPSTTYYFVCRARDVAGNRDTNIKQVSGATTADGTAPTFAGASSVSVLSDTSLQVFWTAATDNVTPSGSIQYQICWATGSCLAPFSALGTTTGTLNYTITGLSPNTTYNIVVRAKDAAGNVDTNTVVRTAKTNADTTPPIFTSGITVSGVLQSSTTSTTWLDASWTGASDASSVQYLLCVIDDSDSAKAPYKTVYENCVSVGGITYSTPFYSTTGTISYRMTGLTSATSYTVSVRAKDSAGNAESATPSHYGSARTATSYSKDIYTNIFQVSGSAGGCVGCHAWTYSNTVSPGGTDGCGGKLVDNTNPVPANRPGNSRLYLKMKGTSPCGGARMPYGGTPNATSENNMYYWIYEGALNN